MTFKDLRLRSGQTVQDVSEQLQVKDTTYRKYECSVRLPNASILSQMHLVYQCNANEVMEAYNNSREVQIKRYGKTNP